MWSFNSRSWEKVDFCNSHLQGYDEVKQWSGGLHTCFTMTISWFESRLWTFLFQVCVLSSVCGFPLHYHQHASEIYWSFQNFILHLKDLTTLPTCALICCFYNSLNSTDPLPSMKWDVVSSNVALNCPELYFECVWLSASLCLSCDKVETCSGCSLLSAVVTWDHLQNLRPYIGSSGTQHISSYYKSLCSPRTTCKWDKITLMIWKDAAEQHNLNRSPFYLLLKLQMSTHKAK